MILSETLTTYGGVLRMYIAVSFSERLYETVDSDHWLARTWTLFAPGLIVRLGGGVNCEKVTGAVDVIGITIGSWC